MIQGTIATALKIGPLDFVLKLVVFYAHERLWLFDTMQNLTNKRFLKMCLWKVIALSMTMITTIAVTGKLDLALKLGPADFFAKLFLYYFHEFIWDKISYGREVVQIEDKQK